ncbi:hypothetical protein CFB40_12150 [Burkholderia sp. AU31652]|uniref:hypothetical protein n=1 Tax=Burkholderia sp. AU31652 TaxID=2015354 RepID=UPI000B79E14F|nr:hypothetical protein [Burkholderia sp. AU31652]OXI91049.1 hypothetical protein CFB40_12150 [Burkholderia sp. AU31652]
MAQPNPIHELMEGAQRALGYVEHDRPNGEVFRTPKPAVSSGSIDLTRAFAMREGFESYYRLNLVDAGKTNDLNPEALMRENSRVVAAGARLIVAPEKPAPQFGAESGANHPGFYTNPSKVRSVLPASFASVTDGQDAALSAISFEDADFSWSDAPNFAFRSKITRAQRRDVGGDLLSDDFVIAIALGLGEMADHLFLAAVLAATPAAFSIGALAARHAKLDEARALVGTAGAGASFRGDGVFVAGPGIPAELTASTDKTVVGLFNRAAVAVRPELSVHVKRLNVSGDQELIVFGNLQPVIPNPAADFWTVA